MFFQTRLFHIQVCGSVHVWDDSPVSVSQETVQAYQRAQRVVFEADYRAPVDLQIGSYQNGDRLSQVIPSSLFADVLSSFKKFGLPTDSVDSLKPWMAALYLMPHQFRSVGITNSHGIDKHIFDQAVADRKTIDCFETMSGQLNFFEGAPIEEQETFLRRMLSLAAADEAVRVFSAYKARDMGALEVLATDALKIMPKMFEQMIPGRNTSWKRTILEKFNDGIPTLIVVGALHCVGPTAVQIV
ncbi:TraB/GumN family protein [Noviherbaspirillum sp. 1P10PC]|uniref:TraB/GumN family protein n=1 Tax=Noviherbaspirillum sp. 1P10PC TaxID=3132292 RepID=UPI00399EFB88